MTKYDNDQRRRSLRFTGMRTSTRRAERFYVHTNTTGYSREPYQVIDRRTGQVLCAYQWERDAMRELCALNRRDSEDMVPMELGLFNESL